MGQLLAIARRDKKRADMQTLQSAHVSMHHGIAQDFRGKPGQRQVTILSTEAWSAACKDLNIELPWTTRRANLLIQGLNLHSSAGKVICIGTVQFLITQETDPCERMEEAHPGLEKALTSAWRGGVCCRVLSEGSIQVGDSVRLEDAQ